MSVAFKAEIQSRVAGSSSSRIRAVVIIPRSPTKATRPTPNRSRILAICAPSVIGSPRLPANTSTATGQPSSVHSSPNTICLLALLAVPVVAERRQRATPSLQKAGGDVIEDQGGLAEMPVGQTLLDVPLATEQPVEHVQQFIAADRPQAQPRCPGWRRPCQGRDGVRRPASSPGRGDGRGCRRWQDSARDPGGDATKRTNPSLRSVASPAATWPWGRALRMVKASSTLSSAMPPLSRARMPLTSRLGHAGEIGAGLLADAFAFAPGLTDEEGGSAVAVGDGFEMIGHGNRIQDTTCCVNRERPYHATIYM